MTRRDGHRPPVSRAFAIERFAAAAAPVQPATCALFALAVAILHFLLAADAYAQTERLIDGEPYDVIVLNEQNQGKSLQVLPLDLPDRKVPANPGPNQSLRVRLVSNPTEELEVSWSGIARIDLFEQMVLAEARRLTSAAKFDEAFEHLTYIHNHYPDAPGLDEAVDQLLYLEASSLYQQGQLERALLLLDELYQRSPTRRGLATAIERVLDRTFDDAIARRALTQARRLYDQAQTKYSRAVPALLDRWRQRLASIGAQALQRMRADVEAGRLREAYVIGQRLMEIWPETPGAVELIESVGQRYPLLRVGVEQLGSETLPSRGRVAWSWSERRVERLRTRRLFERIGVGPDGNEYRCNVGAAEIEDSYRSIAFQTTSQSDPALTGVHLAQVFLEMSDPGSHWFNEAWASVTDRIETKGLGRVDVKFRRPHLRPAGLLEVPLAALGDTSVQQLFEPYQVVSAGASLASAQSARATVTVAAATSGNGSALDELSEAGDENERRYMLNPSYFAASVTQPREVFERQFETPQRAIEALRDGDIDMIDRVFPSYVTQLQREGRWAVHAYRIPTVHALIPNHERPHTSNRLFRRGLVYAIDREKILRRDLLAGTEIPGCRVISGPFSPGVSADDPVAYGYDARIEPRAYDPRHAKTLLQLSYLERIAANKKEATGADNDSGGPQDAATPQMVALVLAHPDHEIARVACAEVVEDLKIIGLDCSLRPLPPGTTRPDDNDWDLLYVDYCVSEPLVDAAPLLGYEGLVGSSSPHLNLALRQLSRVDNWNDAGGRMQVIHQLCYDDTTLIPLWQIVEHLVCRKGIEGIAAQPMSTYQNIETWRIHPAVRP